MNKKQTGEALLKAFPKIPESILDKIRNEYVTHHLFFNNSAAYCNACEEYFHTFDGWKKPEHNTMIKCPNCGKTVLALKSYCNYSSYIDREIRNIVVFMAKDGKAWVSCLAVKVRFGEREIGRKENILIEEKQRYIFTDKYAFRFGRDYEWYSEGKYYKKRYTDWRLRSKFTEPVFADNGSFSQRDKSYIPINMECLKDTCLRYSEWDKFEGYFLFKYLEFYVKRPNVEYLMKAGFSKPVSEMFGPYSESLYWVDWKQNDLRKMLGMNSLELRLIRKTGMELADYRSARSELAPKGFNTEEIIKYQPVIRNCFGSLDGLVRITGRSERKILKYLYKQKKPDPNRQATVRDMEDYIVECRKLNYDLTDRTVIFPRDLMEAHARTSGILNQLRLEQLTEERRKRAERRKTQLEASEKLMTKHSEFRKKLEFSDGKLMIKAPGSLREIVDEGAALNHCVGGYAERHANGKLHILFIRTTDKPDAPYYTMELSTEGRIVQVRGFRNCDMTPEVGAFVDRYKIYIAEVFGRNKKKQKARIPA